MADVAAAAGVALVLIAPAPAAELHARSDAEVLAALRRLEPGDTLSVAAGNYGGGWAVSGLRGRPDAPITIRGQPGTVLRPVSERDAIVFWPKPSEHVVVRGLTIRGASRGGIVIGGSRHIAVEKCLIEDCGVWGVQSCLSEDIRVEACTIRRSKKEHGIYFSTTDRPVVRSCTIEDNAGCGVHLNGDRSEGGDGVISDAVIAGNIIRGNGRRGGAAVNGDGVEFALVTNNLVVGNLAGGVTFFRGDAARAGVSNAVVGNTIIFGSSAGRYAVQVRDGAAHARIAGNILFGGRGPAVECEGPSLDSLHSDGNVFSRTEALPFLTGGRRLSLADWQGLWKRDLRSRTADGSSVPADGAGARPEGCREPVGCPGVGVETTPR